MLRSSAGRGRLRRGRGGTAAVELAIILPLLITIVLGCIDFGRFASTYIAVTNAAREGASFGSMNPVTSVTQAAWDQAIRDLVVAEMGSLYDPARAADLQVSAQVVEEGGASGEKRVSVTVSYVFQTAVGWPLLPQNVTLTRTVQMRVIR
jgi:Flp pilus assembly protein TadG